MTDTKHARGAVTRTGWAAIGAAIAVTLTGGAVLGASAAAPTDSAASSVITMVPCRFLDTRVDDSEGALTFGPDETTSFSGRGIHGDCVVADNATGMIANFTAVAPTMDGYLTVFPAASTMPTASSLNWQAGDTAIANQVTVQLSPTGEFSVYNHSGTTDVVIDVVGYLVPATTGGGTKGDTGAAGTNGTNGTNGANGTNGVDGPKGDTGEAGEDAGTNFRTSRIVAPNSASYSVFFSAATWDLATDCYNVAGNQAVYVGVQVAGDPITVASDDLVGGGGSQTYATVDNQVTLGAVYDFTVTETAGRILAFSVSTYFTGDVCTIAGTVTDLGPETGFIFYDAP